MTVSRTYYAQRAAIISARIERLRTHVEQAWLRVQDQETQPPPVQTLLATPRAHEAQLAAASLMADRLEEHARRLHVALEALRAEGAV